MTNPEPAKRLVIVGGGVAGLEIASTLGRRWRAEDGSPSITLVDRESSHVWKPTLQTTRDPAIYAVGDCASLTPEGAERPLPPTAQVSLADYDAFGSLGQFGLFNGTTFRGRLAQISHVMLYRSHQARIHGFWKGGSDYAGREADT